MEKIPTIYMRNPQNMKVVMEVREPRCDWVFKGEGIPRRKYDGTCVKVEDDRCYKRRIVKYEQEIPRDFVQVGDDPLTKKIFGWVSISDEDKYHKEGYLNTVKEFEDGVLPEGTYELVGPKVQSNPEGYTEHRLIYHARAEVIKDLPPLGDYEALKEWLRNHNNIEGIVWHHPDGRMGKIKVRDFGFKRVPFNGISQS